MRNKRQETPKQPIRTGSDNHRLKSTLALVCGLAAVLLYVNTWNHDYVLDDVAVIEQNRFTQQGVQGIPSMLHTFYWEGYWSINAGLYRPLSLITFAVEHEFFPNEPAVPHVVNILLYGLIASLLFYFLSLLTGRTNLMLPFIATMIFVLHPIHTEVVANIKSRDELLCFLFFVLAAIYWLKWHKSRTTGHLALAASFYLLCLFSKEGGVLFLPIFPLMLYFFRDTSPKGSLRGSWALAIPVVLFLTVHTWVIQSSPNPKIAYSYQDNALMAAPDLMSRVATAVHTTLHYFRLLVWPHPLSHDYSFNQIPITGFGNPWVLVTLAIVAALAVVTLRGIKPRTITSFAILYFAITFSLTSNWIIPVGATMAERFLFAPSLGFALIVAYLVDRYLSPNRAPSPTPGSFVTQSARPLAVLAALAIPMAALTVQRNSDWKDDLTLYTADLQTAPNSARTHYNYATAYMFTVALETTDPGRKATELQKVIRELEKALEIDPNYYDALRNLGIALYYTSEYDRSITSLEKATKLVHDSGTDFYWIGKSHFRANRFENALAAFEKSLGMGTKMDDTYNLVGTANFNMGRHEDAIKYYNKALEDDPNQPEVLNNLASVYGSAGDYASAVTLLLRSYKLDPGNANTCYFLAVSYHHLGDTANAEMWVGKARELGMNI